MWYLLYKTASLWSRGERRVVGSTAIVLMLAGGFFAANAYYTKTNEAPARGGAYTEGMLGQPVAINPILANDSEADQTLVRLLFSSLGELAESSALGPDKKTWTITLKKGLVWSDGAPLTADDVVFTIETIQGPGARSPQAPQWNAVIAEKVEIREVRLTLKAPYAFFGDVWKALMIAPQHIFGTIPSENLRLSRYNLEPVGNGPYAFKELFTEKDGFITSIALQVNKRYHGAPPFIPSFTMRFYRAEQALIDAFNGKEIEGVGGINPKNSGIIVGHRLEAVRMPRYYAIFMNQNAHAGLKEKAVRAALGQAIDRAAIITTVFGGQAEAIDGPLTPLIAGFVGAPQETTKKDTASMLEEAGWIINPEDSIRYKTIAKNRVKLSFNVVTPDIPFLVETMEIIKRAWAPLGIEAKLIVMNPEDIAKGSLRSRDYQMIMFGNSLPLYPDIFAFWHSSQKFYPGLNLALYSNPETDALLESLRKAENEQEQKELAAKIQSLIREDTPALFLYNPTYLYAVTTGLKGFVGNVAQNASGRFAGVNKWHLKTKRVF